MRICVLALANPFFWTGLYVNAFRKFGEVLTVGPTFDESFLHTLNLLDRADEVVQNDIQTDLHGGVDLERILPDGWKPDLIVAISDFGRQLCPAMSAFSCPKVYLSIDTWQSPMDYIDGMHYDFVFAAQREFVPRLAATGARNAHWLPLGCDPEVHYPVVTDKKYDITFAGAIVPGVHVQRARLLDLLQDAHTVNLQQRVYGEDMCRAFCEGRLAFNNCAVNDLNMRIFEVMAMGCPLLTNRDAERNGLLDLFEDEKHLLIYDDENDLLPLVKRYLGDEEGLAAIAKAGREEVLAKHTYVHRVQQILSMVGGTERLSAPPSPPCAHEVLEYLPACPNSVVDLGKTLADEASALRQHGVQRFIGLASDGETSDGIWDEQHAWPGPGSYPKDIDVVVLSDATSIEASPEEAVAFAHGLLREGGTLLLALSPQEISALGLNLDAEALNLWLRKHNFHLLGLKVINQPVSRNEAFCILQCRKRTRTIADVVDEGYQELSIDNPGVRAFVAAMPEGM